MLGLPPTTARYRTKSIWTSSAQAEATKLNCKIDGEDIRTVFEENPGITVQEYVNTRVFCPIPRAKYSKITGKVRKSVEQSPVREVAKNTMSVEVQEEPTSSVSPFEMGIEGLDPNIPIGTYLKEAARNNMLSLSQDKTQSCELKQIATKRKRKNRNWMRIGTDLCEQDQPKESHQEPTKMMSLEEQIEILEAQISDREQLAQFFKQQNAPKRKRNRKTPIKPYQRPPSTVSSTSSVQQKFTLEKPNQDIPPPPVSAALSNWALTQVKMAPGLAAIFKPSGLLPPDFPTNNKQNPMGYQHLSQSNLGDRIATGCHHLNMQVPMEMMVPGLLKDPAYQKAFGCALPTFTTPAAPSPASVTICMEQLKDLVNELCKRQLQAQIAPPPVAPVSSAPTRSSWRPDPNSPTFKLLEEQRKEFVEEQKIFKLAVQQNIMILMRLKNFPPTMPSTVMDILQQAFPLYYKELANQAELPAEVQNAIKQQKEAFAESFQKMSSNNTPELELDRWLLGQIKYETKPVGKVPTSDELLSIIINSFKESVTGLTDGQYNTLLRAFLDDFVNPVKTLADAASITSSTQLPIEMIHIIHQEALKKVRQNLQKDNYYLIF